MGDFLTYMRGSCRFIADGVFPERFINLAARADLGLWDIRRSEGGISARIIAGRYKKLRQIAKKCGIRLHVTEKHGLPFRLLPYRRRAGMPLGLIVFCVIIWMLSQFVWIVDIPQVSPELQQRLEDEIIECGLRPGVLRSSIVGSVISTELQLGLKELSWAGISTNGSRVTVDVREMEPSIVKPGIDEPCNIVAAKDGFIVSVHAANGKAEVAAGHAVSKGDLLITGVLEYASGDIVMVHADGDVVADTYYRFVSEVPLTQHRLERTGRVVTIRRLMILGFEIPLYFRADTDGSFERECEEWQLDVGGTKLPLTVRTERWYELKNVNRTITQSEALDSAKNDIAAQMKALDDAEILSCTESVIQTDSGVVITEEITARENIELESPILFEQY